MLGDEIPRGVDIGSFRSARLRYNRRNSIYDGEAMSTKCASMKRYDINEGHWVSMIDTIKSGCPHNCTRFKKAYYKLSRCIECNHYALGVNYGK